MAEVWLLPGTGTHNLPGARNPGGGRASRPVDARGHRDLSNMCEGWQAQGERVGGGESPAVMAAGLPSAVRL
jgi:hypothetical protein